MAFERLILRKPESFSSHEEAEERLRAAAARDVQTEVLHLGGYNLTPATHSDSYKYHHLEIVGDEEAVYTVSPKVSLEKSRSWLRRVWRPRSLGNVVVQRFLVPDDMDLIVVTIPELTEKGYKRRIWDAVRYLS